MVKLENVSGHKIEQMHQGTMYVWEEQGDIMVLDDRIGGWLAGKLNDADNNAALGKERREKKNRSIVWIRMHSIGPDEQRTEHNIVVASKARKTVPDENPPKPPPAKPPAQ